MATQISGDTGVSQVQDNTITSAKIVNGAVTPADTQVGALPSMVRLNTANGYGSTNTMIRRFTNTVTNQGSDITYADSATLGASFTINTNGVYAITYCGGPNSANGQTGVSLNSTQLTTAISGIAVSDRLCVDQAYIATANTACGWTGYLAAGSIVRAHDDAVASGVAAQYLFTITRVA